MSFTGYHSTAEAEDDNVDWRVVEVEQRVLENARVLWQRCVDQTRKDAVSAPPVAPKRSSSLLSSTSCCNCVFAAEERT